MLNIQHWGRTLSEAFSQALQVSLSGVELLTKASCFTLKGRLASQGRAGAEGYARTRLLISSAIGAYRVPEVRYLKPAP